MSNPGYVYVLINSSMPNLVKVGRTNRDPTDRVSELSSATGVPSPFILVYSAYFNDCIQAESAAHARLESKGYRLSANREFFMAPVQQAINAVLESKSGISNASEQSMDEIECENDESQSNESFGKALHEEADRYYVGKDEYLQDYDKAIELYQKATRLGYYKASFSMGDIYSSGKGRPVDLPKALEYYQQAAAHGYDVGFIKMAEIYLELKHVQNFHKCWKKFFDSRKFHNASSHDRGYFGLNYLDTIWSKEIPTSRIPTSNWDILDSLKDIILDCISKQMKSEDLREINSYWAQKERRVRDALSTRGFSEVEQAIDLCNEARRHYYGSDGYQINYDQAFELYQKAAELGSAEAWNCLGKLYKEGKGQSADLNKCIEYYQQAANRGKYECLYFIADTYLDLDEIENFHDYWNKYFNSKGFQELGREGQASMAFAYLNRHWEHKKPIWQIPQSNWDILVSLRDEILEYAVMCSKDENLSSQCKSAYGKRIQRVKDSLFGNELRYEDDSKFQKKYNAQSHVERKAWETMLITYDFYSDKDQKRKMLENYSQEYKEYFIWLSKRL